MPGVPLIPMLPVEVNVVTPPAATTWPTSSSLNRVLELIDGTVEVIFCCAWEATIAKNINYKTYIILYIYNKTMHVRNKIS